MALNLPAFYSPGFRSKMEPRMQKLAPFLNIRLTIANYVGDS